MKTRKQLEAMGIYIVRASNKSYYQIVTVSKFDYLKKIGTAKTVATLIKKINGKLR